jgi:ArsR family transcriptional regulator
MAEYEPMSMADAKYRMLDAFAEIARAIGHEHRLELLNLIAHGERTVERLAELANLSVANASQHLQHLKRAGLVSTRRAGKYTLYRLTDPIVLDLITTLHRVGGRTCDHVKAINQDFYRQRDADDAVSRDDVLNGLKGGNVVVLDVRPADEYALGHVPGAINIPFRELEERMDELSAERQIVTYCRGPYCVVTFETVRRLRERGYRVRRLQGSFPEWQASGFPYETTSP